MFIHTYIHLFIFSASNMCTDSIQLKHTTKRAGQQFVFRSKPEGGPGGPLTSTF